MVSRVAYTSNISRNSFRWPINEDILNYTSNEFLCYFTPPLPLNRLQVIGWQFRNGKSTDHWLMNIDLMLHETL